MTASPRRLSPRPVVAVLGTGGTIASRKDPGGGWAVQDGPATVAAGVASDTHPGPGVEMRLHDLMRANSYQLTPADQQRIAVAVAGQLADDAIAGVVVTHGTDTMEETAALLELCHDDPRPIVLTGAQRTADGPDPDGPANLAAAVAVAADPASRGRGVLIVFDDAIHAALGTRKVHTLAAAAFADPDRPPLGRVVAGRPHFTGPPASRPAPVTAATDLQLDRVRTDVVAYYPGADGAALRAVAAAGSRAIVLEAVGAGNANPAVVVEVRRLSQRGVVVGLTTRVTGGPVYARYGGGGGGVDLIAAGAIPMGGLPSSQARILLSLLVSRFDDPGRVRSELLQEVEQRVARPG